MRIKARLIILLTTLILFFLLIPPEAKAQEAGLAISGPLVSGSTFDCVPGQRIESYIRVENTGSVPQNISFSSDITKGVLGGIDTTLPSVMRLLPECASIGYITFEIQAEASAFVEVLIQITAAGLSEEGNKSVVHAAASARVRFRLSNVSATLHIRTLDQWSWPIPNLDISISREYLEYVRQRTDVNGTTSFILAPGLYRVRVYDNLSVLAEAVLNVTDDRYFEFNIYRGLQPIEPATIHLAEIVFGIAIGYLIRYLDKGKSLSKIRRRLRQLREHRPYEPA